MKNFLLAFHEMIEEKKRYDKISDETIQQIAAEYQCLSEREKEKSIWILYETLQNYDLIIFFMSNLLSIVQDRRILHFLQEVLSEKKYALWVRLNDMSHLQSYLFFYPDLNKQEEYSNLRRLYQNILDEIQLNMKRKDSYLLYAERKKYIVIVLKILLTTKHAPTKLMRYVYDYYQNMGYEVECFVCYLEAKEGNWYRRYAYNNFVKETTFFKYELSGSTIKGYNLVLQSQDYIESLEHTIEMIRSKKPEFVLEIGDQTILAGLCTGFTTVVSMGCTKKLPVTNAPIIASLVAYSEKEKQLHNQMLDSVQRVVEVRCDIQILNKQEQGAIVKKETFNIPKDNFVVIIAGNRLDGEIRDDFIRILYQILQMDDHFVIAVIGECPKLKKKIKNERILFLGVQSNFREAIAVGDVFLNPPRQGGGTGGLFAVLEEVPVITLGDCDVEINVGSDFVCADIEEMPKLVYRYFSDSEFMEQQKENCRKRAKVLLDVDNEQDLCKLCHAVKEYALQTEQNFDVIQT